MEGVREGVKGELGRVGVSGSGPVQDHTELSNCWNAGGGIIGSGCLCLITWWNIYTRAANEAVWKVVPSVLFVLLAPEP